MVKTTKLFQTGPPNTTLGIRKSIKVTGLANKLLHLNYFIALPCGVKRTSTSSRARTRLLKKYILKGKIYVVSIIFKMAPWKPFKFLWGIFGGFLALANTKAPTNRRKMQNPLKITLHGNCHYTVLIRSLMVPQV